MSNFHQSTTIKPAKTTTSCGVLESMLVIVKKFWDYAQSISE